MKNSIIALILTSTFLFHSCATIISGSRQGVRIFSEPSAATVYINEIQVGKTPIIRSLKRNQEYRVAIELEGFQRYETRLSREFNNWYLGNLILGGLIGLIIDPITGAIYKLTPEELNAKLDKGTAFSTKGKNIYLTVSLEIDPNWKKVGQLDKTPL